MFRKIKYVFWGFAFWITVKVQNFAIIYVPKSKKYNFGFVVHWILELVYSCFSSSYGFSHLIQCGFDACLTCLSCHSYLSFLWGLSLLVMGRVEVLIPMILLVGVYGVLSDLLVSLGPRVSIWVLLLIILCLLSEGKFLATLFGGTLSWGWGHS